jgi:hypothetical protein
MSKHPQRKVRRYSSARTVTENPYRLDPDEVWVTPTKIREQDKQFVQMPWSWIRRLKGAGGATWMVACHILYLDWKRAKGSFKLANGMLKIDGVPSTTKRRALRDLARRGLITVEWQPKKSPIVQRLV